MQNSPVQIDPSTNIALITSANGKTNQSDQIEGGFNEQVFEPSPLNELVKLELTKPSTVNKTKGELMTCYFFAMLNNHQSDSGNLRLYQPSLA